MVAGGNSVLAPPKMLGAAGADVATLKRPGVLDPVNVGKADGVVEKKFAGLLAALKNIEDPAFGVFVVVPNALGVEGCAKLNAGAEDAAGAPKAEPVVGLEKAKLGVVVPKGLLLAAPNAGVAVGAGVPKAPVVKGEEEAGTGLLPKAGVDKVGAVPSPKAGVD